MTLASDIALKMSSTLKQRFKLVVDLLKTTKKELKKTPNSWTPHVWLLKNKPNKPHLLEIIFVAELGSFWLALEALLNFFSADSAGSSRSLAAPFLATFIFFTQKVRFCFFCASRNWFLFIVSRSFRWSQHLLPVHVVTVVLHLLSTGIWYYIYIFIYYTYIFLKGKDEKQKLFSQCLRAFLILGHASKQILMCQNLFS